MLVGQTCVPVGILSLLHWAAVMPCKGSVFSLALVLALTHTVLCLPLPHCRELATQMSPWLLIEAEVCERPDEGGLLRQPNRHPERR